MIGSLNYLLAGLVFSTSSMNVIAYVDTTSLVYMDCNKNKDTIGINPNPIFGQDVLFNKIAVDNFATFLYAISNVDSIWVLLKRVVHDPEIAQILGRICEFPVSNIANEVKESMCDLYSGLDAKNIKNGINILNNNMNNTLSHLWDSFLVTYMFNENNNTLKVLHDLIKLKGAMVNFFVNNPSIEIPDSDFRMAVEYITIFVINRLAILRCTLSKEKLLNDPEWISFIKNLDNHAIGILRDDYVSKNAADNYDKIYRNILQRDPETMIKLHKLLNFPKTKACQGFDELYSTFYNAANNTLETRS